MPSLIDKAKQRFGQEDDVVNAHEDLLTLDKIRKISWGRTYLWNVKFVAHDLKPPYDSFFPANSVEENVLTVDSKEFEMFNTRVKIPVSTSPFDIKITFYDDVHNTLRQWLTRWANLVILGNGHHTAALKTAVRMMTIEKHHYNRSTLLESTHYWVYPEGALYFVGNSESGVPMYNMTFVVVGFTPATGSDTDVVSTEEDTNYMDQLLEFRKKSLQTRSDLNKNLSTGGSYRARFNSARHKVSNVRNAKLNRLGFRF